MIKTKRVFKLFYVWNLDKEEAWLRSMANRGWFFQKINLLGIYTFLNGPCKDTIYKIDFNTHIKDMNEYYDLFRESGWQFINSYAGQKYFKYTKDAEDYPEDAEIYSSPEEKLGWLRKRLIAVLAAFAITIISLYTYIFLQNGADLSNAYIIFWLACFAFISIKLAEFLNSFILLKRKARKKEYKDYYNKGFLKKVYSTASLLIFPVLIAAIYFITFIYAYTVSGSYKAIANKVVRMDSYNHALYPVKRVDYVASYDFDKFRVCLYGNNEQIGIMALENLVLDRYEIKTDFSGRLPSEKCIMVDYLNLGSKRYTVVYGKDKYKDIDRFVLIYKDGTTEEVTKSAFTAKDNYFMILGRSHKLLKEIMVYDKRSIDITDEYSSYISRAL